MSIPDPTSPVYQQLLRHAMDNLDTVDFSFIADPLRSYGVTRSETFTIGIAPPKEPRVASQAHMRQGSTITFLMIDDPLTSLIDDDAEAMCLLAQRDLDTKVERLFWEVIGSMAEPAPFIPPLVPPKQFPSVDVAGNRHDRRKAQATVRRKHV